MMCLEKELDLQRLNKVFHWLWVAGRPMPPRPLHHQLLLSRDIFVTEQMDMHLVWTTGRIFVKPIPRFLLDPNFWTQYISCEKDCKCSKRTSLSGTADECDRRRIWRRALGFLFSYAALISHESDFYIAKEKRLLPGEPGEVTWGRWRTLVEQLETESIYQDIDARFVYGELRLSRLNKIYSISRLSFHRRYMSHWNQYRIFLQDSFAWLACATVYIIIVLTAMQVGLATESLADKGAFQSASYGFTVFSILSPLIAMAFIFLVFCCMFVNNWIITVVYKKERFYHIQSKLER